MNIFNLMRLRNSHIAYDAMRVYLIPPPSPKSFYLMVAGVGFAPTRSFRIN